MRIVGTDEEQHDRRHEEELLRRCVLIAIVELLPQIQVVVGAGVEVEGNASNPVKHEIRTGHVRDVGEGPGGLLGHAGDDVIEDLEDADQDGVNEPGACSVQREISGSSSIKKGTSIHFW